MVRVAVVAALLLAATAASAAGPRDVRRGYDTDPAWSPDGTKIAFRREEGNSIDRLLVMSPDGSGVQERAAAERAHFDLSPDWRWLALVQYDDRVSVLGPDDREPVFVARSSGLFGVVWTPDSRRIAFWNGRGGALPFSEYDVVARTLRDVAGLPSPVGGRYASMRCLPTGCDAVISDADGGRPVVVARAVNLVGPWSPDGRRIAYGNQTGGEWVLGIVNADGSGLRLFPTGSQDTRTVVWGPGADSVTLEGLTVLDLRTGRRTPLPPGFRVAWSPDGTRLALVAGGECDWHSGIYVGRANEQEATRITNSCRILGTAASDALTGTDDRDLIFGFGGDDRLRADSTDDGYTADDLHGGDGNDTITGGVGPDLVFGDGGNDTIDGGLGADVIVGGPGRDVVDAGRGRDVVAVRDDERDRVFCGPNAEAAPRKTPDVVYADRLDVVASDCEKVFRA